MPRTRNRSQLNVDVPPDVRAGLTKRAEQENRSLTATLIRAIRVYLSRPVDGELDLTEQKTTKAKR
jgi:hypothetical protein